MLQTAMAKVQTLAQTTIEKEENVILQFEL
jgi:hypothetical protein